MILQGKEWVLSYPKSDNDMDSYQELALFEIKLFLLGSNLKNIVEK